MFLKRSDSAIGPHLETEKVRVRDTGKLPVTFSAHRAAKGGSVGWVTATLPGMGETVRP